ncbi:hypothetical protein J5U23_00696 [Saccharolobus shibatae B12]|uniref:Uncharacterized protein n=1 Tax=Saccharolobus shibatae (strain ATCC 51178 / DSM 5389 / JCM 8931 / NBRC 15437 / B12) TaxID=523848 RepID=A0A8F5BM52_SACSH|nr:hypothetical protein [Saccharolobus shibatae]QXJ27828.1 hypothetical protein J5U23_00696 [Saccharolobus shibatae B12]
MQYFALVLLVLISVGATLIIIPYVSLLITTINNVNAKVYTVFNSSVSLSGTWLVNGSKFTQVSTTPTNRLIVEVAQGSYAYFSNKTWSEMLSDNGDNGPIFSPYAVFNLSAGNYSYNIPTQAFDFESPIYNILSDLALFFVVAIVFILFMILSYSRRR